MITDRRSDTIKIAVLRKSKTSTFLVSPEIVKKLSFLFSQITLGLKDDSHNENDAIPSCSVNIFRYYISYV